MNTRPIKVAVAIATGVVLGVIAKDTTEENLDKIEDKAKAFVQKRRSK